MPDQSETWSARKAANLRYLRMMNAPLALGLAALILFSGCSVDVVSGQGATPAPIQTQDADRASEPATAGSGEPTVSAEPQASEPQASDTQPRASQPSVAKPTGPNAEAYRSYYADQIDVTTSCPGGEIVIGGGHTVRITEACDKVTVTGSFSNVLAERVGTLIVTAEASHSYFLIRELASAKVEASFDHLYWDSGNPHVQVSGFKTVASPNPVKENK